MCALADNDVALFVFDLGYELGKMAYCCMLVLILYEWLYCCTFFLQWILGRLGLGNVNNAMHIERNLFCVGAPVLVAEAVCVAAVHGSGEGMVARGDSTFVDLVSLRGIGDLVGLVRIELQSVLGNIVPRSQYPNCRCHQTLDLLLGRSPSSCRLRVVARGSILVNAP